VETWFIEYCFQILCAHMIVPYVRHISGVVSVSLCLNSKDLGVVCLRNSGGSLNYHTQET